MDTTLVKKRVVGVDIKLEETMCAVVDVRGEILARASFPSGDYPDVNAYVAALSACIVELVEANGGYETIRSVGISAPSGNFMMGCMVNSPNMPWKGVIPLAALLRDRLGLAVAVANNAYVSVLGEHAFGCARGMRDFVLVTLGSGFGSCFFSNGKVHHGFKGFAGEVGHTCVEDNGRKCGCGNEGCLEAYVAAKGIVRTARELMEQNSRPSLMRGVDNLTPKQIAEYCNQGDELAIEVYRLTGEKLGLGLANYASLIDPEAVIFSGRISKAGDWLLKPAKEAFDRYVFHNIENKVKFLVSEMDSQDLCLLGASVLAWEVKEYSLFK